MGPETTPEKAPRPKKKPRKKVIRVSMTRMEKQLMFMGGGIAIASLILGLFVAIAIWDAIMSAGDCLEEGGAFITGVWVGLAFMTLAAVFVLCRTLLIIEWRFR